MKNLKLPDSGVVVTVKDYFTRGAHKYYLSHGFITNNEGKTEVIKNLGKWEDIADQLLIQFQIVSLSNNTEVTMDFIDNLSKNDYEVLANYLTEIRKTDNSEKKKD